MNTKFLTSPSFDLPRPDLDQPEVPFSSFSRHLLIAMPDMQDSQFAGSVIYLCEHDARGALGVMINHPGDLKLGTLFDKIGLKLEIAPLRDTPVLIGGPVQSERGFVLHRPVGRWSSTLVIDDDIGLTTSKDILEALPTGYGPEEMLVTLGYAGWSAGQLEAEIAQNAWLTVPVNAEQASQLLFATSTEQRLAAAYRLLGIDPLMLSSQAGHA
ncbi:YqgE/AlgH family protein [Parvibium lacunae]|uniref:UPF0301 protein DU000_06875 n=1 Tax=Parvibium lacunae TaxID=1888893 RepID=A0A368L4M3_9BURK|nr:YqgE/AlgH family protein [Parvibium lacunae]RCS58524.1 YqgE/AlgH family protein [Parvibium lacunae]